MRGGEGTSVYLSIAVQRVEVLPKRVEVNETIWSGVLGEKVVLLYVTQLSVTG